MEQTQSRQISYWEYVFLLVIGENKSFDLLLHMKYKNTYFWGKYSDLFAFDQTRKLNFLIIHP